MRFDELRLPDETIFIHIPRLLNFLCSKCGSRDVKVMPIFPPARGQPGHRGHSLSSSPIWRSKKCGRVAQHKGAVEYGSMLKIKFPKGPPNAPAHYNGAPGQDDLIARSDPRTHDTTLDLIRWGLLPSWAKDRKMAWT